MPEDTQNTFAHFIDPELLEARVADFHGDYDSEELAATAFYLGVLSLTGFSRLVPIYGDTHDVMHVLSNVYAGEWLTEIIVSGSLDPKALYQMVLREHGDILDGRDEPEDIKSDTDGPTPMDKDTFARLWNSAV